MGRDRYGSGFSWFGGAQGLTESTLEEAPESTEDEVRIVSGFG